jgi:hypothetical protein
LKIKKKFLFNNQLVCCTKKNVHVSSGKMYIIVDQNGLFSWFWCTNFSFLSL